MTAEQVFDGILVVCGGAALAAVVWGIKHGTDWLVSRTHNERLTLLLRRLDDVAERVVREIYQSYVQPLQANGQWSAQAAKTAREQAITRLKQYIGPEGLKLVEYVMGFAGGDTLDVFLGTYVEASVHDLKREMDTLAAVAAPAVGAPTSDRASAATAAPGKPTLAGPAPVNPS